MSILLALLVAAWPLAEPSSAQAPKRLSPRELVTVSGCVAQPPRTGSLSTDTAGTTSATPNTAGVEANSQEAVNAFVLLDATPSKQDPGETSRGTRTSYTLQGREAELAVQRGHRVKIVGYLVPPPRVSAKAEGTPQRIAVKSVKILESHCSAAASPPTRKAQ